MHDLTLTAESVRNSVFAEQLLNEPRPEANHRLADTPNVDQIDPYAQPVLAGLGRWQGVEVQWHGNAREVFSRGKASAIYDAWATPLIEDVRAAAMQNICARKYYLTKAHTRALCSWDAEEQRAALCFPIHLQRLSFRFTAMNAITSSPVQNFAALLASTREIADGVAARNAVDVDAHARFPIETVDALRAAGVLSAPIPRQLGGAGCTMHELTQLCATLAKGCGASGMVLAMHYSQLACLARHGLGSEFFLSYMHDLVRHQYLLASITSEVGTFGDTRTSICAVIQKDERFVLNKDATTGSYCAHADAMLVTCRRDVDSASSDQVLVLVKRDDASLTQTTTWDTLGMRGTCSPGYRLESSGAIEQIVPGAFADSSAQTMVPYSHILWASLWWGIAADAVGRAATYVRSEARKKPGTLPPTATRLAEVSTQLQAMRQQWQAAALAFDQATQSAEGEQDLLGMGWALRLNNLKIACSEAAPQIVHRALQIVGVLGYKNDSPFSLGRHYRDVLSASLMISNDRIVAKNASMLLVHKDTFGI